jgi:hypothetical protein
MSDQTACHKTFTYKLQPTAEQGLELERVVLLCRRLSNTALDTVLRVKSLASRCAFLGTCDNWLSQVPRAC